MDYDRHFTAATRSIRPVAIREIADRIAGEDDVISLAAGWPDERTFPAEAVSDLTTRVLRDRPGEALQYGTTLGYDRLREQLADRASERYGVDVGRENVLVTAGSQQGIYVLAKAFLEDGDQIAVGAPTYVAALSAFRSYRDPDVVTVPLDDDGLQVDRLADRLADGAAPKLVYVVPTFQNPTGTTMAPARRERLVELADEHDFLVVEDQPYRDLRFGGEPTDPLLSHDPERVIHLGTFSKVLAPGMRIGWTIAPEPVIRKLEVIKQPIDLQTNVFAQHVASEYAATGTLDDQVDRIREIYREKRDAMLEAMDREFPDGVDWSRPDGGMFLWVTLPEDCDADAMLDRALDRGVAYIPGNAFYANDPDEHRNTMRLCFSYVDRDAIREGIATLGDVIRAEIDG